MKIFITGSSGFVGNQIIGLNPNIEFVSFDRNENIEINESYVFHFAGLAHNSHKTRKKNDYIKANYLLTKKVFNAFKKSKKSKIFIFLSSSKVSGLKNNILVETRVNKRRNVYSESKYLAEKFLLNEINTLKNKKVFILRPSIIFGKNVKGNFKFIKNIVKYNLFWPFGNFTNKISILDIRNLNYTLLYLISNNVDSGIYNLSNNNPIELNQLIVKINKIMNKKARILFVNKTLIKGLFSLGNFFNLPFLNIETFSKITDDNIVSNKKILKEHGKFPYNNDDGIKLYFNE